MAAPVQKRQKTLAREISCAGVGVHSGQMARAVLRPGPEDSGFVFVRSDLDKPDAVISAHFSAVTDTVQGTTIGNASGAAVLTVEHLLSACVGMGLDNAVIELDGPEAPILDGSALVYAQMIADAGLAEQGAVVRPYRVVEASETRGEAGQWVRFAPREDGADGLALRVAIDFPHPAIGRQSFSLELTPEAFLREIAPARTYGFLRDWDRLRAAGRALGSSLENTIALDDQAVVNPEGLRFADEFVRHKVLDAIGDLALLGAPMIGVYAAEKPGHTMTYRHIKAFVTREPAVWTR